MSPSHSSFILPFSSKYRVFLNFHPKNQLFSSFFPLFQLLSSLSSLPLFILPNFLVRISKFFRKIPLQVVFSPHSGPTRLQPSNFPKYWAKGIRKVYPNRITHFPAELTLAGGAGAICPPPGPWARPDPPGPPCCCCPPVVRGRCPPQPPIPRPLLHVGTPTGRRTDWG